MALITGTRLLGEILVADGVTTPEMITAALNRMQTTGERLGEALVALGAVTKDDVLKALAVQNNLPYLFRGELPSPLPVVKNLSPKYLRQYVVCPIAVEGGMLTVATADPLNPMIVDDLRQSTGLDVRIVVSPGEGILEAIDRTYDGAATPLQRIVEGLEEERGPEGEEDVNHLRDMAFEAPVIRLVNLLVENAIAAEASDIHIEPFEDTLRVRYRIDGILFDQESPPRRLRDAVTSRIKLMAEMNIAERRLPQDGRIRVSLHGRRVDIRVSTIPTVHGESIVMRLLDRASVFLPLEKLGFGSDTLKHFEALIHRPHGILLVTGPTGSGKTTTLYAALEKINSPDRKILTVEDPVEYQLKGVNQIPVKPKIGLSFATGLRHIVRQDPDVILVGEIRDLETVDIAIQAARPHRTHGLLHAAHQRRPGRHSATARHGRRAVSDRLRAGGRARPAARAADLPGLPGPGNPVGGRHRGPGRGSSARRDALSRPRVRRVSQHRVPRPNRHLRVVHDHRGRSQSHSQARVEPRDPSLGRRGRHDDAAHGRLVESLRRRHHRRGSAASHAGRRLSR